MPKAIRDPCSSGIYDASLSGPSSTLETVGLTGWDSIAVTVSAMFFSCLTFPGQRYEVSSEIASCVRPSLQSLYFSAKSDENLRNSR